LPNKNESATVPQTQNFLNLNTPLLEKKKEALYKREVLPKPKHARRPVKLGEGIYSKTPGKDGPVKDEVVSLLPNLPSSNDEDLHKGVLELSFCLSYHLEKNVLQSPS